MEKVDQYMMQNFAENGDEFVQDSKEYLGLDAQQALDLKAYVDTKWGFLRNVININSFFSGLPGSQKGQSSMEDGSGPFGAFDKKRKPKSGKEWKEDKSKVTWGD